MPTTPSSISRSGDQPDAVSLLDEIAAVGHRIESSVAAAVVTIGRDGRGSGFVVAPDRVVTNAHNLRDRSTLVTFGDGRSVQGRVVGADATADLVVLDVETADAPTLSWADQEVTTGAAVFAVARTPHGSRVTVGFVSGVGRSFQGPRGRAITNSIEHTAPMGRGSSGGVLVDANGHVVGINTHRVGEGFYLAQSASSNLHRAVTRLADGHSPRRLLLGVSLAPSDVAQKLRRSVGLPERAGILVRGVAEGGPAALADIREGDLIVAAGANAVTSADDLAEVLSGHDGDTPLTMALVRGSDELDVSVSFLSPTESETGSVPDSAS